MAYALTQSTCERDFRRYADTVAVLSAIKKFFDDNPSYGSIVEVEPVLKSADGGESKPDLSAVLGASHGIVFEFKWSLPKNPNLLEKELFEARKYFEAKYGWRTTAGSVDQVDVILVCHVDDGARVADLAENVVKKSKEQPFASLAVWAWELVIDKERRQEQLRIAHCYGKTTHGSLDRRFGVVGGVVTPEDVLRYLRFQYKFIRQEPPVQYTIGFLVQNVLPVFQTKPERDYYKIELDWIYDHCSRLYPPWQVLDETSKQIKRSWIVKALRTMVDLKLIDSTEQEDAYMIPIPTIVSRKGRFIEEVVCRRLVRYLAKKKKKAERFVIQVKKRPLPTKTTNRRISEFLP